MGGERLGGIRGGDRTPNQTPGKGNSRVNRGGSRDGQTEKPGLGQVTVTVLLMETGKYATLWEQCVSECLTRVERQECELRDRERYRQTDRMTDRQIDR